MRTKRAASVGIPAPLSPEQREQWPLLAAVIDCCQPAKLGEAVVEMGPSAPRSRKRPRTARR